MPKRTNTFQKLIYVVERYLAKEAVITESKFLIDKQTGSPVEVDIVIESSIGGLPLIIGIECTAKNRPATVEWVREMVGKHSNLPIDKTILVSKSGFTQEAAAKAQACGFVAITLKEVQNTDWLSFLNALKSSLHGMGQYEFSVAHKSLVVHVASKDGFVQLTLEPLTMFYNQEGELRGNLWGYVFLSMKNRTINDSMLDEFLNHYWEGTAGYYKFTYTLNWQDSENAFLQDKGDIKYKILAIELEIDAHIYEPIPVEIKTGQFMNTDVIYAATVNSSQGNISEKESLLVMFWKDGKIINSEIYPEARLLS
jgi:hypothetical protein